MRALLALLLAFALSCDPTTDPQPPGELQAGVSRVRMPVPLGIGTAGFGPFGVSPNPTPFAEVYPGTERIHGHPSFEAVALSRGPGHELVFLRADTVGIFQQLRRAVVLELEGRTGRDFDDVLVLGATHTHSGPGRVIDAGGPFDLIADTFFPEFYDRMVQAMADTVQAALDDLQPARLGHATALPVDAHSDRRCEDGRDYTNSTAPLLVVERQDRIEAVLVPFAIHGTVLGIGDLTLSPDVHGGIEEAVEDRFEHPVEVLAFNSWGADMAPTHPPVEGVGSPQPDGYEQIGSVGEVVADAVEIALTEVRWSADPTLSMTTHRVPIDRQHIGYEPEVFPYEHGAVYCGANNEADCDPATVEEGIDQSCVAFSEDYPAPDQTEISVGEVGDLHFVTWPGEPGTILSEQVLEATRGQPGVRDVVFFGYAQDYLGYALTESDWWQGGYEASGALWGPRQGEYLRDRLIDAFEREITPGDELQDLFEPPPVAPFSGGDYEPRESTTALGAGDVVADVSASYGPTDVIAFTVAGHDPWLGAPVARLEHADGAAVERPGGRPVDSDGLAFWVDLATDPTYRSDMDAAERAFHWTFSLPASRAASGFTLGGDYRLVATLADGTEVASSTFTVAE